MRFPYKMAFGATLLVLALLFTPVVVVAQNPNAEAKAQGSITGKYQGTIKGEAGEIKVSLDLVDEGGKYSGSITTERGTFKLIKGQMADGNLTLEFETTGPPHKLTVRQKGNTLVGNIFDADKPAPIEFHKVVADEISGEWDAAADA